MDKTTQDLQNWELFQRAMDSLEWRVNNLYYIKDRSGEKIQFKMNRGQRRLFKRRWYKNIILKARQRGYTTFILLLALDYCLFTDNYSAGINAHNLEDAQSFFKDKVKFAYDNLPNYIKQFRTADTSNAKELAFPNGSRIKVSTSLRSGTYQFVHISEFGKICATDKDRAREIVTGTLNAVGKNQIVFIESTAEGKGGEFYEMCQTAISILNQGKQLSLLDYKFFFSPWWDDEEYNLDPEGITISQQMENYFNSLAEEHNIHLTPSQKAWYTKKSEEQKDGMKREYPSTPEESFEAVIKGALYKDEILLAEKQGRIGNRVEIEKNYPVHTVWDLGGAGGGDFTAIWFFQIVGNIVRIVDYWQGNGYSMPQIIKTVLVKKMVDRQWKYGQHFAPHDIMVTDYSVSDPDTYEPLTRKQVAFNHGIDFTVLDRLPISDNVDIAREVFSQCVFDSKYCAQGVDALREVQRVFDKTNGIFKADILKNWAIHGADSFRYLCQAYRRHITPKSTTEIPSVASIEQELAILGI